MTPTPDLRELLAKAPGLPWAYRPQEFDDWGVIRTAPDEDGNRWYAGQMRGGRILADEEEDEHRRAGTDPYGPAAELTVEAVNALPSLLDTIARLEARERELVEALRPFARFADEWADDVSDDLLINQSDRGVTLCLGQFRAARTLTPETDHDE